MLQNIWCDFILFKIFVFVLFMCLFFMFFKNNELKLPFLIE